MFKTIKMSFTFDFGMASIMQTDPHPVNLEIMLSYKLSIKEYRGFVGTELY